MKPYASTRMLRVTGATAEEVGDDLAVEEPLEIQIGGRSVSVTMRTPGHDTELAAGFLLTEGIIHSGADIAAARPLVRKDGCNVVNVALAPGVAVDWQRLTRHIFTSSSCGLCGKATIDAVHAHFPPVASQIEISAAWIRTLTEALGASQHLFARTGGLHAAALFEAGSSLVTAREDIGRHNAVDKVIGYALMSKLLPLDRHVLLVSGRASFEIMQKALAARIPVVAAVSAPSSLAVEFARESNQTLAGFLRDGRMNVYAGRERITLP